MDLTFFEKIILSLLSVIVTITISLLFKQNAKNIQQKEKLSRSRYFILKRLINIFSMILLFSLLVLIWGISFKSLWVSVTGILAMIAVAFFAVWSLVGNILAGIILYFTSPFKIGDRIKILPDDVYGRVLAINIFFTVLQDDEENLISIPNSLFFQRFVQRMKR